MRRDIVVAAGEAAGGRDRADCGDSAHGEIIDVVELERAGDGRAHGVHIIGIVREREGSAAAEMSSLAVMRAGRALSDGAIGLQAHIGGAGIDGLIERESPTVMRAISLLPLVRPLMAPELPTSAGTVRR